MGSIPHPTPGILLLYNSKLCWPRASGITAIQMTPLQQLFLPIKSLLRNWKWLCWTHIMQPRSCIRGPFTLKAEKGTMAAHCWRSNGGRGESKFNASNKTGQNNIFLSQIKIQPNVSNQIIGFIDNGSHTDFKIYRELYQPLLGNFHFVPRLKKVIWKLYCSAAKPNQEKPVIPVLH